MNKIENKYYNLLKMRHHLYYYPDIVDELIEVEQYEQSACYYILLYYTAIINKEVKFTPKYDSCLYMDLYKKYELKTKQWIIGITKNNMFDLFVKGIMYRDGIYVEKNEEKAEKYFESSAILGNPLAYYMLARLKSPYITSNMNASSVKYFEYLSKCIKLDETFGNAHNDLYACYKDGIGTCKNKILADKHLQYSLKYGSLHGIYNYAEDCIEKGKYFEAFINLYIYYEKTNDYDGNKRMLDMIQHFYHQSSQNLFKHEPRILVYCMIRLYMNVSYPPSCLLLSDVIGFSGNSFYKFLKTMCLNQNYSTYNKDTLAKTDQYSLEKVQLCLKKIAKQNGLFHEETEFINEYQVSDSELGFDIKQNIARPLNIEETKRLYETLVQGAKVFDKVNNIWMVLI